MRHAPPLKLLFLSALAVAAGCQRVQPPLAPPEPPEVVVDRPVERNVTEYEDFSGRTEAIASVELRSRVTGYLQAPLHFVDGTDVEKDALLFTIDPKPYKADVDRTEAAYKQAEAHRQRVSQDYERYKKLGGRVSAEELDKAAGDYAEAEAAAGSARAMLETAKLNLDFTRITAPLKGRISRRAVDPGNLIKADETMLSTIVALDPIYVNFDVDDRTMLRIRRLVREGKVESVRADKKTVVEIGLPDEEGHKFKGEIDFADPRVDPNTGTLRLRAVVPNKNTLIPPGLYVRVRLPVGAEHPAILVPERAIGTDQGEKYVFVLDKDDKVVYRPVQLGSQQGSMRVVMPKDPVDGKPSPRVTGVTTADRVIVDGLQRVRNGAKVTVKAPEAAAKPAATPTTKP